MKIITAAKYRHFVPQAPELSFNIPSLAADGSNTLLYEYLIREVSEKSQKELPSAFWALPDSAFKVYIDGILQKPRVTVVHSDFYSVWTLIEDAYSKPGATRYLNTNKKYLSSAYYPYPIFGQVDSVVPMALGMTVKIVSTEVFDGWYHLDIRRLLIQGANPMSQSVLGNHDNFQGGYRLEFAALDDVKYGQLRRCDYQLGWDYKPPPGFRGIDSFSYALSTEFGQLSEPACCSIKVGY